MLTIEKTYPMSCPDLKYLETSPDRLTFFDIETTGFTGDYSAVYLIGCIFPSEDSWRMVQFFADSPQAQKDMLSAFSELISRRPVLVHFNGDRFDIPFLQKRCIALGKPDIFEDTESIDILKRVRPLKKLLELPDLKQKTVERFLGINREDRYSGGELISVYQSWLKEHKDRLLELLLLHNEEDLLGMPKLLSILRFPAFLEGGFRFLSETRKDDTLYLSWRSETELPVPVSVSTPVGNAQASGTDLQLTVPLYRGELRHFYKDFANYYYLPEEDCAIHKSVGEFIDRSARKKATAKTCYTRASGLFVPEPAEIFPGTLRREYGDKACFALYREGMFCDDAAQRYLAEALRRCR